MSASDPDAVPAEQQGPVKNWATIQAVVERVRQEIIPMCQAIRSARLPLENYWQRYEKAWTMEHELQSYFGRSNIYMPVANKQVETLVGELVTATFPSDEFFNVEALKSDWQQMAGDVKALENQRMKTAKVRVYAEAYYRQLLIKGNSSARVHWKSKKKRGHLRKTAVKNIERDLMNGGSPHTFTYYEGPCFTPIPIEGLYMWPENAQPDDASVVFEDLSVPKNDLIYAATQWGRYVLEAAKKAGGEHEQQSIADQQRLIGQGFPNKTEVAQVPMVGITHCFVAMDPKSDKFENDVDIKDMCVTFAANGEVLRVVDAEVICPGRCHPYVMGRAGTLVGRMYGTGFVERIYSLQLLMNDQMNQAMDSITYQLNPIVLSNPNAIIGTLPDLEPGVQVLVNDIANAVKFDRPPDFIQGSATLLTQTMSFMQDFFGSPPVLQGGAAPGRAFKTALGVGTADKNAKTPLLQMVRLSEVEVWEPMLQMFWLLDQRFADQRVLIEQGGLSLADARFIDPTSLYGDYRFGWLASTQAQNLQVLAQQLQAFIQLIVAPAVVQMLAAEGVRVQLAPIIERVYRALGLRDVERILVRQDGQQGLPSDAVNQQQPVAGPPPMPQGPQQPQVPNVLGPNAGNAGQNPGGDFGAMRQVANALAAMHGPEGGHNNMPGGMMPPGEPM